MSVSQSSQKQFRGVKSMRELSVESPSVTAFRSQFEASRSFDLEDDMEFCPKLLTENDVSLSRSPPSRACSPWDCVMDGDATGHVGSMFGC